MMEDATIWEMERQLKMTRKKFVKMGWKGEGGGSLGGLLAFKRGGEVASWERGVSHKRSFHKTVNKDNIWNT